MLTVSSIKNNVKLDQSKNFNKSIRNINSLIPATTHVDGSARIQTINEFNGKIFDL